MNRNDARWITYPIFISSTFRDMDYERDAIKFNVIPRLNDYYRKNYIQFQPIDLRIGINTESIEERERENYVLEICLNKIDMSRPFFIALLGGRYGWIPSYQRWKTIVNRLSKEKRPLLHDSQGRSVTEMEILYGAIGDRGDYINHSIFMMRSPHSYEKMPQQLKGIYTDEYDSLLSSAEKEEKNIKLERLKKEVLEIFQRKGIEDRVCNYDLNWNIEKNCFDNIQQFSDLLFDRLCAEVNKEVVKIPEKMFYWYEQEKRNLESDAEFLVREGVTTQATDKIMKLLKDGCHQLLIMGETGTGKSIIASQCYKFLINSGYKVCLARIGQSIYSRQMRPIISRWILELCDADITIEDLIDSRKTSDVKLYELLHDSVKDFESLYGKVAFVVDGIEQLVLYDERDLYQMWINDDIFVVLTTYPNLSTYTSKYHNRMKTLLLEELDEKDKVLLLKKAEKDNNIQLPASVRLQLTNRPLSPLRLKLLLLLFNNLSISDFHNIRSNENKDEMNKINSYLENLYHSVPSDFSHLVKYVINTICERMGLPIFFEHMLMTIAASQCGLREKDLELLMGEKWDALRFHSLSFILRDFLELDQFTQQWKIRSKSVRDALVPLESKKVYNELSACLLKLPDDDYLKRDILLFSLIKSEDYSLGNEYLGTYSKYKNEQDMKTWFKTSTNLLLADPHKLENLSALVSKMPPIQATTFVYCLITFGIDDLSKGELKIRWCEYLLKNIFIRNLDRKSAYQYATLFMNSQLYIKYNNVSKEIKVKRREYLKKALDAYEYCHEIDPKSHNVCNMLSAALLEMIDFAMEDGDFSLADELMQKVSQF